MSTKQQKTFIPDRYGTVNNRHLLGMLTASPYCRNLVALLGFTEDRQKSIFRMPKARVLGPKRSRNKKRFHQIASSWEA